MSVHRSLLQVELFELSSKTIYELRKSHKNPNEVFELIPEFTINTNEGANNRPVTAAEWKYKTAVDVAKALSGVNVPSIFINGGDGKSGGSANPMDAIGINMLLDIKAKLEK